MGETGGIKMQERLEAALANVNEMFAPDGMDLELEHVESGVLRVRMVFTPEACEECIVPTEMVERIVFQEVRKQVPEIERIEVIDPRPTTPA
jgi:hypothetical protein